MSMSAEEFLYKKCVELEGQISIMNNNNLINDKIYDQMRASRDNIYVALDELIDELIKAIDEPGRQTNESILARLKHIRDDVMAL